jgi:hypothetical protein
MLARLAAILPFAVVVDQAEQLDEVSVALLTALVRQGGARGIAVLAVNIDLHYPQGPLQSQGVRRDGRADGSASSGVVWEHPRENLSDVAGPLALARKDWQLSQHVFDSRVGWLHRGRCGCGGPRGIDVQILPRLRR